MSENTSDYFDNYSAGLAALAREYPDIEPHFGQSIPGLVPTLADEEVAPFLASSSPHPSHPRSTKPPGTTRRSSTG
ncbi:hypothetical protein GCM10020255_023930 [Rhodococcus baikonurensis]